jgi:hypothetical protein
MSGAGARPLAGRPGARAPRRAVRACRLYATARLAAAFVPQRHAAVHLALSGQCGDAAGGGRQPAPPRRRDRGAEHPAHVGADAGPPSARALRGASRRPVARSSALDPSQVRRLLSPHRGPQSRVSREVCRRAAPCVRARGARSRWRHRSSSRPRPVAHVCRWPLSD